MFWPWADNDSPPEKQLAIAQVFRVFVCVIGGFALLGLILILLLFIFTNHVPSIPGLAVLGFVTFISGFFVIVVRSVIKDCKKQIANK